MLIFAKAWKPADARFKTVNYEQRGPARSAYVSVYKQESTIVASLRIAWILGEKKKYLLIQRLWKNAC